MKRMTCDVDGGGRLVLPRRRRVISRNGGADASDGRHAPSCRVDECAGQQLLGLDGPGDVGVSSTHREWRQRDGGDSHAPVQPADSPASGQPPTVVAVAHKLGDSAAGSSVRSGTERRGSRVPDHHQGVDRGGAAASAADALCEAAKCRQRPDAGRGVVDRPATIVRRVRENEARKSLGRQCQSVVRLSGEQQQHGRVAVGEQVVEGDELDRESERRRVAAGDLVIDAGGQHGASASEQCIEATVWKHVSAIIVGVYGKSIVTVWLIVCPAQK